MRYVPDWRKSIGMQLYTIEMTDLAKMDLESLGDYIAYELCNPMAAERIVHGIRMRVNELKNFPMKYRLDEDVILAELGVHRTNFENYEIDKVGEGLSNNFQIVIEGKYHIKCIHHHFDANADKPFIKGTDVYYNRIWEYINEKYLKRLERMKKEKDTIFIYYEPNLKCDKLVLLPEIAKKYKCLAFTNKLETTKELKVYPIDKSWKAHPPLVQHYNKEILEFINENRDNNDKLD